MFTININKYIFFHRVETNENKIMENFQFLVPSNLGKAEKELSARLEAVDRVDSLVNLVIEGLDLLLAGRGEQEVVHLGLESIVNLEMHVLITLVIS